MRRTSDPPGLALSGEADLSNRYALAATIAHLPEDVASEAPLAIDLSDLTFADVGTMRLFVQVAALSNLSRAQALAKQLGGQVRSAGTIHRVQLGPFADNAAALRARGDVARRGYGDARIISLP